MPVTIIKYHSTDYSPITTRMIYSASTPKAAQWLLKYSYSGP